MIATPVSDQSRELACTRVYKASKELLLRMWANPEHLAEWWGPRGFTTTTHAMEFKTDGFWRFTMHGPDGSDYPSVIKYTYTSADRIEYEQSGAEQIKFTARIDFREVDGGTEMSFRMTFPTAEIRRKVVEEFGAEQGQIDTVARLGEYVADKDPDAIELVIVRQFDAPQEQVWRALTEPEQLKQWQAPIGMDLELRADELRVGGRWNYVMSSGGFQVEADGEFLAVEPDHLLELTHPWKKDDGTYKPTTTISYKLHTHDGKTTLVFIQTGFWSEEARFAHLGGWTSCLDKLAGVIGASKAHQVVELSREFDAPLALVWKCWTEPQNMAEWFAPRPYTCPRCEIDFRPGGSIYLVMRSPDGDEHAMSSIIVDIELLSRLGWVNSVLDSTGSIAIQGASTVTFEDLGGRTRVSVLSYATAYSDQGVSMVGGMQRGWNMTIDQMIESALSKV